MPKAAAAPLLLPQIRAASAIRWGVMAFSDRAYFLRVSGRLALGFRSRLLSAQTGQGLAVGVIAHGVTPAQHSGQRVLLSWMQ